MHKPLRTVLSYIRKDQIPAQWRLVSVGDLLVRAQYGMNAPTVPEGKIFIVGMKDIQEGRVRFNNLAKISVNEQELSMYSLHDGDLLINRTNSLDQVGKVGIVDNDHEVVFASYLVRLIADRSTVEPDFLNYWLNSNLAQRTIKRIATPAIGQANINPTEFQKYCLVPLPTRLEQLRIVEVLHIWDDAIDKIERLITAKERYSLELSRRVLEQCVPSCSRSEKSHPALRLDRLFKERDERATNGERLLAITGGRGVVDRDEINRRDTSNEDKDKYKLICPGDIGYNTMRMWQGVCGLSQLRGIVSPAYTVVTPRNELILGEFAALLFKLPRMIHEFRRYSQGLVDDTLSLKFPQFSEIKVRIPELATQKRIAACLGCLQDEIVVIEKQAEALKRQKRGLMQKLLTGEWRVPMRDGEVVDLAERAAEAAQ